MTHASLFLRGHRGGTGQGRWSTSAPFNGLLAAVAMREPTR